MNSSFLFTLVQFIVAFSVIAIIHELGHYLMAKSGKIEVEEFGLGFPPRAVKLFHFKETLFSLNWIPFGAFVRPKGENDPEIPGGLAAASPWKRLGMLLGGPFANILFGILIFAFVFSQVGAPDTSRIQISEINPGSPAEQSGLLSGDLILSVAGLPVTSMSSVSDTVRLHLGEEIAIIVLREGSETTIRITPRKDPPEGEGPLGVVMGNPVIKPGFFQSIPLAASTAFEQAKQLFTLPLKLIQGQVTSEQARLVSPKGLFDIYSQVRNQQSSVESSSPGLAVVNILWFFGIISVALGLTNLLPIPALDGGRILFVIPELIAGKRVPAKYENAVHMVGFTFLLALMAFLFLQDFINPVVLPK
jgi:regulator of sigma E protease